MTTDGWQILQQMLGKRIAYVLVFHTLKQYFNKTLLKI